MKRLRQLLAQQPALHKLDIAAQLQWLEDVAEAALHADLGSSGIAAACDLRAALGAIVAFAQTAPDERDLPALDQLVRGFITRALNTLGGALDKLYAALGNDAAADERAELEALRLHCRCVATMPGNPLRPNVAF